MAPKFDELRAQIDADPERRARVEEMKRAVLDAIRLSELREKRQLRQQDVAATLAIWQARVSNIERGDDLYLSTLAANIAALGGELRIEAVLPEATHTLTAST